MDNNKFCTHILTIDDLNKIRPSLLKNSIEKIKNNPYEKVPIIKQIWYKFIASKKKEESKKKLDVSQLKRVLIFRYDALGDYIVTTPIVSFLKRNNPNIIIDVVTSKRNDAFIKNDKNISNTYIADEKHNYGMQTIRSVRKMKKNEYDVIFALVSRNTRAAELAYLISPTAHKIAFSSPSRIKLYSQLFDTIVSYYQFEQHQCELQFKSIILYFEQNFSIKDYPIYFPISNKAVENANQFAINNELEFRPISENILNNHSIQKTEGRKYVIINLTGYSEARKINEETASFFIAKIAEKYTAYHFYISGAPSKKELLDKVAQNVNLQNCSALSLPFDTFATLLTGAKLVITPDSAPIHLASASKVAVVGLYVSKLMAFSWYPFNTKFTMLLGQHTDTTIKKDIPDINLIDRDKIIQAVDEYLCEQ